MGNATLARQRAQGLIGQGRVSKLYDEGRLVVLFQADYERLTARLAELERDNHTLRAIVADSTQTSVIAAQILGEAMGR